MTDGDRVDADERPTAEEMLARIGGGDATRERGRLRVYLGMAPGVGKTFRMLEEGHRRTARGTDLVVGFVEAHGRPETEKLLAGLEIVPRRHVEHRGVAIEEMDTDAILARAPAVALVDELAHTNAPGSAPHEALGGRPDAARCRHRRREHLQHPASRLRRRRGRDDHRVRRSTSASRTRSWRPPTRSSWWT